MIRFIDLSYMRSVRYLMWNRKFVVIAGCLSATVVVHVLFNTIFTHDSSTIPSSYSPDNKSRTNRTSYKVFPRLDYGQISTPTFKKKIIVLSYMRSGSTLMGDIIQSHPGVFYVYEPLLYLWDYYVPQKMDSASSLWSLWQRTKTFWKSTEANIVPPLDFLTYMFNCNMTVSNLKFLTNTRHSQVFQSANCPIVKNGMNILNTSDFCVNRLKKRCNAVDAVLLKVVRLSMLEADEYLESNPDLKIIHLVRDPRGILLSRMNFNDKETGEMHNNYSNICRRIFEDIQVSQTVSYKYHGRILTMRYEDLAQNIEGFARKIFDFIGLALHPEVVKHLEEITSSQEIQPNGKLKAKKTKRRNPYRTAYKWRHELPFSVVKKVDAECKDLYKVMGYRHFVTEADLRNEAVSARSQYYGNGLITAIL